MQLIDKFSTARIMVIGDLMLDRYWWGKTERISPEAPVPVVLMEKSSETLGGAANVAVNIAGLGAEVYLIGICGRDEEGRALKSLLHDFGISSDYLIDDGRPTTVKTRIVARNQHVVRVDREEASSIDAAQENKIFNIAKALIENIDAIILSDYAKGLLTWNLTERLITLAKENNKKLTADPKGKNFQKYKNASAITPNQREAMEASKFENIDEIGWGLLDELSTECILITQGEKGMTLFSRNGKSCFPALARSVCDVTGAGDTVIATFTTAIACGSSYEDAAHIANIAAGIVVEEIGTSAISTEKLKKQLTHLDTIGQ